MESAPPSRPPSPPDIEIVKRPFRCSREHPGLVPVLPVTKRKAKAATNDKTQWSIDWVPFENLTDCDDSEFESKFPISSKACRDARPSTEEIGSSKFNTETLEKLLQGRPSRESQTQIRELTAVSQFTIPELIGFGKKFKDILFRHQIEKGAARQADLGALVTREFRQYNQRNQVNEADFKAVVFPRLVAKFRARMSAVTPRHYSDSRVYALLRLCSSVEVFEKLIEDRAKMEGITLLMS